MEKRIHIFAGHFGSGKTEVALNFAIKNSKQNKKVAIADLDIVNPYFRTKDAEKVLLEYGVEVISSEFAGSNLDMPTVPKNLLSIFQNREKIAVLDVGGDDDGAFVLGQYNRFFQKEPYEMYFVVNLKRPMTSNYEELCVVYDAIESASRLKFTGIVNNTNLAEQTTIDTLIEDYEDILKLSDSKGVPIVMQCAKADIIKQLPNKYTGERFAIDTYLRKPWEV